MQREKHKHRGMKVERERETNSANIKMRKREKLRSVEMGEERRRNGEECKCTDGERHMKKERATQL